MNDYFEDNEVLFRCVKGSNPVLWDDEYDRPTSAVFKDSKGLSVDRDGKRDKKDIIKSFNNKFDNIKAIVSVNAGYCKGLPVHLKYKPTDNKYHSEIHESENEITIKYKKLKKLSEDCIIEYINE